MMRRPPHSEINDDDALHLLHHHITGSPLSDCLTHALWRAGRPHHPYWSMMMENEDSL